MFKSLNDTIPAGTTEIWYQTKSTWENVSFRSSPEFSLATLEDTHIHLGSINLERKEDVFRAMQGENWSPEGEARDLIEDKGLVHTSMSVNDIIKIGNRAWRVASFGFKEIK